MNEFLVHGVCHDEIPQNTTDMFVYSCVDPAINKILEADSIDEIIDIIENLGHQAMNLCPDYQRAIKIGVGYMGGFLKENSFGHYYAFLRALHGDDFNLAASTDKMINEGIADANEKRAAKQA